MKMAFLINGELHTKDISPVHPMYSLLFDNAEREHPCESGTCMRCLVLMGERTVPSCMIPAYRARSEHIRTAEGMKKDKLYKTIVHAFEKHGIHKDDPSFNTLTVIAYAIIQEDSIPIEQQLLQYAQHLPLVQQKKELLDRIFKYLAHHQGKKYSENKQR